MDLSSWIETIFQYGPYALLVLFVFWVAPRQMQAFKECKPADKGSRILCGSFAVVSWGVIVAMTGYIFVNWSGTEVYMGTLGKYETQDNVEFYTMDQGAYVSTAFVSDTRMEWKFAVVADSQKGQQQEYVTFTYRRDGEEYDHDLLLKDLKANNLKLFVNTMAPENLLFDHDNNPATPLVPYQPQIAYTANTKSFSIEHWFSAYALESDNPQDIIDALNSNNKFLRASARKKLRTLSLTSLKNMLDQTTTDSKANKQIAKEIRIRKKKGS